MPLQSNALFQPHQGPAIDISEITPLAVSSSLANAPSINIFPPNTPFSWTMGVRLSGTSVPAHAIADKLTFTGQLEPLVGPGTAVVVGSQVLSAPTSSNLAGTPPTADYVALVTFTPTPGQIPPGAYMLTVVVTATAGAVPIDIAGFDQVIVQVAPGA